jgi:hypothetical protein
MSTVKLSPVMAVKNIIPFSTVILLYVIHHHSDNFKLSIDKIFVLC